MKCNAIETNILIIAYPNLNRYRNFANFDNSCALLIAAGIYGLLLVILTELLKISSHPTNYNYLLGEH